MTCRSGHSSGAIVTNKPVNNDVQRQEYIIIIKREEKYPTPYYIYCCVTAVLYNMSSRPFTTGGTYMYMYEMSWLRS